jgi:hypothetical protein
VLAATGLDQEGGPGNANKHGGDRVRGEPVDVALRGLIATSASSSVQDEHACAQDRAHREQLRIQGCRRLRSHEQDR